MLALILFGLGVLLVLVVIDDRRDRARKVWWEAVTLLGRVAEENETLRDQNRMYAATIQQLRLELSLPPEARDRLTEAKARAHRGQLAHEQALQRAKEADTGAAHPPGP